MIGDTNLFFNDPQEPHTAEVEIMIADTASRGKRRGWESVILMIRYGNSMPLHTIAVFIITCVYYYFFLYMFVRSY